MPSLGIASKLSLTTAAVRALPSLKVTPERRWKVKVVASLLISQLWASQGTISPVSGFWSVSESTSWRTE